MTTFTAIDTPAQYSELARFMDDTMPPTADPQPLQNRAALREAYARQAEHILITGDDTDEELKPTTVVRKMHIKNHARGESTELTFYAEGFLRARAETSRRPLYDVALNLKFVDPGFRTSQRRARRWLALSGLVLLTTSIALAVSRQFLAPSLVAAAAALGFVATLCALLTYVYRRTERIEFATRHGRASVLCLRSSLGCLRRFRRAAAEVARTAELQSGQASDMPYLRAEMQEHYALRDRGVISPATCAQSTQRILKRFDQARN